MKEVLFKSVSIKNFLSIGDEPIEIKFGPGIHIITGINKDKEDFLALKMLILYQQKILSKILILII